MEYVNSEDSNQPARPCSLIRVLAVQDNDIGGPVDSASSIKSLS